MLPDIRSEFSSRYVCVCIEVEPSERLQHH